MFYRARAGSKLGGQAANFIGAAVLIAVVANLIEVLLVWNMLNQAGTGWRTAVAAAATIKFSAIAVGATGIFAFFAIVLRNTIGKCRRVRRWRRTERASILEILRSFKVFRWLGLGAGEGARPAPWWNGVLAPKAWPEPTANQAAVKEAMKDSGQPFKAVIENQRSWQRAYSVPGVTAALKRRTEPLRALCLSGGGVRSACVSMGAMQVFSKPCSATGPVASSSTGRKKAATLLDGLDYVISVSGGGYAAGARLLAVQRQLVDPTQKREEQLEGDELKPKPNIVDISERFEEGSAEFDHIRRGSSYLADSPLGLIRALAEVFKNLVASLAIIFSVPVIAGSVAGLLLAVVPIAAFPPISSKSSAAGSNTPQSASLVTHPGAYWAVGVFAVLAVLCTVYVLITEWRSNSRCSERRMIHALGLARANALFALVIFALTIALPALMLLCSAPGSHTPSSAGGAFAALSGVVGVNYVAALVAIVWRDRHKLSKSIGTQSSPRLLKRLLPPEVVSLLLTLATLALLSVVWLALLGSFAAGAFQFCAQTGWGERVLNVPPQVWWLGGLAFVALFLGFADVTSLSLHPFYRRCLARTFAVRRVKGQAAQYDDAEPTWLHLYGRTTNGPEFVFACSATISGPDKPAPGLNAVSFVMSADYVGGPELGWFHTDKLFQAASPRIRRDLTVEAAVAVSGAAFASAMGRQNKGVEKLLAISGARLGTWLPNPNFVRQLRESTAPNGSGSDPLPRVWPKSLPSIRGGGYLYREILGINDRDARLVQVTDGGHYDNSGLVEALRRRCRLIIVIDGGGDPPPLPVGLTDALRLARYELGVEVTLNRTGPYSVESITPGSGKQFAKDDALASLNSRITRGAVVQGAITYPAAAGLDESTGTLIFAKAVLSERCPFWLLTYAASTPIFPHDPTSDQWFTEAQFAAYTSLGRIIAEEAVGCLRVLKPLDSLTGRRPAGNGLPPTPPSSPAQVSSKTLN
ncbi:hypothetical protein AWC05_20960 [Mycobacterium florentinum]|uniref:PNPLA domain-containing protein n=1 Tax=Mycobacterium florentinum TaxID=292462 RepID=A0A1X1U5F2_MYCFL|nr:hypothetical protein AWC05_20960 [Mycobacterium florentinum]